jgi:hypothetical protein
MSNLLPVDRQTISELLQQRLAQRQERYGPVGEVQVRGRPLTRPIYWTGRQWAVTALGLEERDGTSQITKATLLSAAEEWSTYEHMASKAWVDVEDFAVAFCEAQILFRRLEEERAWRALRSRK